MVEVSGAATLEKSLAAMRFGGIVTLIGVLTGTADRIPAAAILPRRWRMQGNHVGFREMFSASR